MDRLPSRSPRLLPSVLIFWFCTLAAAQSVSPDLYAGLRWRLIGPFRGGRAVAVAGVPGSSTTFYFGAVNGGIWQTTDGGMVWKPIFDSQHVASIGALAVAPSDPKVIYAGTGESDIRSDLSSGDGVYKSQDGGRSWTHIGLTDSRQISRIVIDPHDANTVFVAVLGHAYGPNPDRGVYKTTDGGANWIKVLDQGPETGAADLAIAANKPAVLFATVWHAHRPPWSTYAPINGPGSGLYRSTDAGQTWTHLTGNGLPEGDWGRSGVAVSPDGRRVYAVIDARQAGLYRSDDGGDHWILASADRRLTSRAWYFSHITIDPQNPDVLYMPNVALYRTEDGGKTISIVRGAPGGDDYHQIWVDPTDSSRMALATDQGTTISVDYGKTWTSWFNQPTAQLYHVITDDKFPYAVYGNQQDSGAIGVLSRTDHSQIGVRDSFSASGSEAGYIAPDPADPNILYVSGTQGEVGRFDLRTSLSQDITPWPFPNWATEIVDRKYRDPWAPVLLFSPADHRTLYFGSQFVMKTTDGGLHWETISPDLTGATTPQNQKPAGPPTPENAKQRGYGVVNTIAPSALNPELIWAGSDTGLVHITRDAGKTWKNVTPPAMSDWSAVSFIEASHSDPAEAYAAIDRHQMDDRTPYLFRTRDYGATWQPITSGIEAPAFLRAIREDAQRAGLLFAGTEFGVYASFDDGDHWQPLQLNLPVTSVQDLVIHGDDLVIATHGRSFWILDDITPLRQTVDASKAHTAWLYQPGKAIRVDNDSFLASPTPPEEPAAENPPNGAILDYYLAGSAKQVTLEILDGQNNLVRSFKSGDRREPKHPHAAIAERWFPKPPTLETAAGMHRFVWDLNQGGGGTAESEEDSEGYGAPHGPRVIPGAYQLRLTVDGTTFTQPLVVVMDPRSVATAAELEQQYDLGRQMFEGTVRGRQALAEVMSVRKELTDLEPKLEAQHADLKASVTQAISQLAGILNGTETSTGLLKASTGIAAALRVVEGGDRSVPAQAMSLYQESDAALKRSIDEWARTKATQLPELNQKLTQAKMAPLTISEIELEVEDLMSR